MDTIYTVDYFIEKFSAIPLERWVTHDIGRDGNHCAFGHCGLIFDKDSKTWQATEESRQLQLLFGDDKVTIINDKAIKYGNNPKDRILNKLKSLK